MKKILAMVLALAIVFTFGFASAATITINQTADGEVGAESYNMYKIFDVTKASSVQEDVTEEPGEGEAEGFSYTISTSNPWFNVLGSVTDGTWNAAQGQEWVTLTHLAGDSTKYAVHWANDNSEAAAKAFSAYLMSKKGKITPNATMTSDSGTATETVDDGYWLIESTLGTSLILATTNITINTKNSYPTAEKSVKETNYSVGDMVPYTIEIELPATVDYTKPVIVHDTMDSVLALNTSSVHGKVTDDNDFDDHITLIQSSGFADDHEETHAAATGKTLFDLKLDISSLAPAAGATATAKKITITYEAELLSTAAADTEYVNKEFVEYSEYKTPEDEAEIKTYDFQLKKTFSGEPDANLEATFILVTDSSDETTAITFITDDTGYVKTDSDDADGAATLTVKGDEAGINVRGLKAGKYYLIEKTTADGYNLLNTSIEVTIDESGNATVGSSNMFQASDSTITVNNQSGTVLPSTGGIGTTVFYVIGGLLILGAAIILVARRKAESK
ncbi:MAG: isopeptide-forming domain-containing fimbrial protein [Clostridia bacterium]|nr:isopeptide-forming domain-containing fimbrial protein [Clostridia bacterium]